MKTTLRVVAAILLLLLNRGVFAQQLRLGDNPYSVEKSAVLELSSPNQGLLLPRISDTTAINLLSPPDGMVIYFTPNKYMMIRSSGSWRQLAVASNYVLDPGTNGIMVRTALNTSTSRTLTGTANRISITNGDGTGGNPTFDISSSYTGQTSITTLGTIGVGTWNGTKISEVYGGTNQTSYSIGDILYASAVNTLSKLSGNTTATKKFLSQTGDGVNSAAPVWSTLSASDIPDLSGNYLVKSNNLSDISSAATARTNIGATTVGSNFFTLTNPSALGYIRVNADNTLTHRSYSNVKVDLGLDNVENTALSAWAGSTNLTTLGTIGVGTWNGTKISEAYGGTNQTSYMIGDMLYASASNTLSKLSGNTTATKKFLTQTGNGTNSTAPSWGTLSASDIPDMSGTYLVKSNNLSDVSSAATARTNIGATTVGANFFTLTNPSALGYIRVNADNTLTHRTYSNVKVDLGLDNVENTALSTWSGSTNITTVGTITSGTWNGNTIPIANGGTGQTTANAAFNALAPSQTGNSGKTLTTDGTNTSWTNDIKTVMLSSDVINNNATANTIADVTGLSFSVTSGNTYKFKFVIAYTSAATGTGSRWSINGPSTTFLYYYSTYSLTTTTTTTNQGLSSYDVPAASNTTSAATGSNIAIIEGIIKPSANGTVIARFASEVSSSAITAKTGSYLEYKQIN